MSCILNWTSAKAPKTPLSVLILHCIPLLSNLYLSNAYSVYVSVLGEDQGEKGKMERFKNKIKNQCASVLEELALSCLPVNQAVVPLQSPMSHQVMPQTLNVASSKMEIAI